MSLKWPDKVDRLRPSCDIGTILQEDQYNKKLHRMKIPSDSSLCLRNEFSDESVAATVSTFVCPAVMGLDATCTCCSALSNAVEDAMPTSLSFTVINMDFERSLGVMNMREVRFVAFVDV